MNREFKFPLWMCDPHLEEMHELKESGEVSYMLERIKEITESEREMCEWCKQKERK